MTTTAARKDLGQFWTPEPIARAMVQWVSGGRSWRVLLDPAVGPGVFVRAALCQAGAAGARRGRIIAFDLDPSFRDQLASLAAGLRHSLDFRCEDFLLASVPQADAIVCNPPYMKHHFIRDKFRVFAEVEQLIGVSLPKTVSVHALFLLKALATLAPAGRLAFIIPSEFLNADYGVSVKRFLLSTGLLRGIASFDSHHLVFPNALTTACVLFAESPAHGSRPTHVLLARVTSAPDLEHIIESLQSSRRNGLRHSSPAVAGFEGAKWWPIESLEPSKKWHGYFGNGAMSRPDKESVPLHAVGHCSRGIATGANSFFLLSAPEARRLGFKSEELVRCVGRASDLRGWVVTEESFSDLVQGGRPTYLLSLKGRQPSPAAKEYIAQGQSLGLHKRYLTRMRERWYEVETREPPDFFVSVFFRGKPKVVLNKARVVSLTAFHGFYLDPMFRVAAERIVRFLNTPQGALALVDQRREYGAGLMKLEPRDVELARVPRSLLSDGLPSRPTGPAR